MKPLIAAAMCTMCIAFIGLSAGIAHAQGPAPEVETKTAPVPPAKSAQNRNLYRGSKVIGSIVRDRQDRKIGEIKDLLFDSRRGEVAYAVVNFGGVLGVGSKYHAIPWQALQPSDDGRYYVLQADRETIGHAPSFDRGSWPDLADQRWSADVDRYWSRRVGQGSSGDNRLPSGAAGEAAVPGQ